MKKIICAAIAAGLLAAGPLAASARANEGVKDGSKRQERAEKMIKERLGLNDEQAAKLKAAHEAEKAAVKPLREQAKEAERKLEEEVRGLASDKEIQATLDQIDAGRKAMAAEREKLENSLSSVLKPYQRAKLRLLMARMRHGRKGHEGHQGEWKHHERGHAEGHERGHHGSDGKDQDHHDD